MNQETLIVEMMIDKQTNLQSDKKRHQKLLEK